MLKMVIENLDADKRFHNCITKGDNSRYVGHNQKNDRSNEPDTPRQ